MCLAVQQRTATRCPNRGSPWKRPAASNGRAIQPSCCKAFPARCSPSTSSNASCSPIRRRSSCSRPAGTCWPAGGSTDFVAPHATILALVRQVQATRQHHLRLWHRTCAGARRDGQRRLPCQRRCRSCRSMCSWCCIPARSRAGWTSTSRHRALEPLGRRRSPRRWRTRSRTRSRASGVRRSCSSPVSDEEDRPLIQLICDETDRICALVERMEEFGDAGAARSRAGQHPSGAGACAADRRGRLRPAPPHRRALRSRRCRRSKATVTG